MSLTTTAEPSRYQFDQATNTVFLGKTESGSACYTGQASKDWAIGNVPNCGYVVSLILDSVLQNYHQRHQKHPVALNCYFFGKTLPGGFVVEIEELKSSSKGYCICRAVLKQYKNMEQPLPSTIADYTSNEPITKVHGIFTMGNMDTESGKTHYHNNPKAPSRDKMIPTKYAFMGEFFNAQVDPSTFPRSSKTNQPILSRPFNGVDAQDVVIEGKPELSQCMSFADGRPMDLKAMGLMVDLFMTPPLLLGTTFWNGAIWCPTMQLEIQFKRIPQTHEILAHFTVPHIINNRFDLDGEIFDADGNILAVTKHQCLVVDWSRNVSSKPKL
ncbi:thioesterase-like superfamily-domain-containing protein [Absidia repens]|uniref:Thioesterase-like superfamily-domain-containing protein n=1 Tax=Absidia repens TaxID=90262 RepID=A0A1X2IWJ4_9FUNG|nr:thioesterase-like superfamily-domain-containing protein [Absidia repens]